MLPATADLDAGDTLSLLEAVVRRRRQAEVDDLLLVLHYADLHSAIPADTGPGGETLGDLGGDGSPGVQELAVVELGIARQVHTVSARRVVADALDLRHRLPHTWDLVRDLQAEVWVARRVAGMARRLSYEAVALVDRAVADAITGQSPGRVLDLAAAKIIEADQAAHDARVEAERRRRFVALTRIDATGLRSVIARVAAGDAAGVHATLQQVADLLATREEYTAMGADELRAEAFAWLARPHDVTALLAGEAEPRRTLRTSVLYVHLSEAALAGAHATAGVARVEGLGPHSLAQLITLLGHDRVIVKPVIDLNEQVSVHAYEHPEAMKERIRLRWTGDAFPHATADSHHLDIDHPVSYDPTGPPGQTTSHTGQPLSRTPHRAKTHLGYACTPTGTGEMLWRTPHGLYRLVDATGTHTIDAAEHDAWLCDQALDRALVRLTHRLRTGAPV
ncbi:MAG: hypothetical protein LH468_01225 [Nocardioides sp.]|nr:hypothetical protein [Nocardioides sp.]